ncbi:carotenoid oxygenase family protein [Nocardia asteroides]
MPLHLTGNNAPVTEEAEVEPTEVRGQIPPDLAGMFVRNGPNPRSGWSPHYFAGDGMVHAVALSGGRARWYRNRYVRTPLYSNPGRSRGRTSPSTPRPRRPTIGSPPPTPTCLPMRVGSLPSRRAVSPISSPRISTPWGASPSTVR